MKTIYRIIILLAVFTFLTTYHPNKINVSTLKKDLFFEIDNIKIFNNYLISEKTIIEKLNEISKKNILFVEKNDIEKSLRSINFLEKVEVKKKYPNTITIKVYETRPVAILFKKDNKYVLDNSSNLIPFEDNILFNDLPSVFGEDAEKNFMIFFDQLENNNFSTKLIKNFYYFRIGRWDLELFDKKIIKFPSNKTIEAIQQSVELLSRQDFENYDIIDLRIHGKIVTE